jgi:hypothetical protein
MPDDKSKVGDPDRSKVAKDQDYVRRERLNERGPARAADPLPLYSFH